MASDIKNPKVSVMMLVWNSEKYLREAINSILNQSFTDFEFIIMNDGSTDRSLEIIKSFKDNRIVLINNEQKIYTIVGARNHCLKISRGIYVAPLDSDDIAHQDRLRLEVDFLDKNPDYALVGAGVRVINNEGRATGVVWKEKIPDQKIPMRLLFSNCFAQSSVMMRKSAIPEVGYIEGTSEDYALWVRMLKNWKAKNLPQLLLEYRAHEENTTHRKKVQLHEAVNTILLSQFKELGIQASLEELNLHRANYTFMGNKEEAKTFITKREQWLVGLSKVNQKTKRYDTRIFNEVIAERFLTTLESNSRLGFYNWKVFIKSPISRNLNWFEEWYKLLKFFIKCLLKR